MTSPAAGSDSDRDWGRDRDHDWDPAGYDRFADARSRPAADLLRRVPCTDVRRVVDLGCGSGLSTALLVARWPDAATIGVDRSPAMLAAAARRLPGVAFHVDDAASFTPPGPVDVIFANALMQWLPDHSALIARWLAQLRPGGTLAVQVPDNLEEPAHHAMRETAAAGPWADQLAAASAERTPIAPAEVWYDRLIRHASAVDVWTTVYHHVLDGSGAIIDWFGSTGLKPYLDPLDDAQRRTFLAAFQERLQVTCPPRADGRVLLRFPRLFAVAVR